MSLLEKSNATILPIDSEHNALLKSYYLLAWIIKLMMVHTINLKLII